MPGHGGGDSHWPELMLETLWSVRGEGERGSEEWVYPVASIESRRER